MSDNINGQIVKRTLLEVIEEAAREGPGTLQTTSVLNETSRKLHAEGVSFSSQALLTMFYDLFRNGFLSWGYNLSNPGPPFIHITDQGRVALQHFSRDPYNPDGYLFYLSSKGKLNDVATSYIQEALSTYNTNCFKAAAVMIGAAAESVILHLRDTVVHRIDALGLAVPKDLLDWRIKRVLDALSRELGNRKNAMPKKLSEVFEAYWPAFTQQIRAARNDAGHPSSIDPVTPETVHASLLIFPELVALADNLMTWTLQHYN